MSPYYHTRAACLRTPALAGALLCLLATPISAQQTAAPQILPEVVVQSTREVRPTAPEPIRRSATRRPVRGRAAAAPPARPLPAPAVVVTPAPTINASPVVVSPTALVTPADQVGSAVTVITAAQLDAEQRRTVPDALAAAPGLNVVQTGGPGSQTSVFIRGNNSNHVKVLIDGIDVSDPSNPNDSFDFGQLQTGDIDRIEILRGPQSGLYGSDAIGGVISVITKKGSGPPKVSATIEGGSFGTLNQKFNLSGSQQAFNYSFNVLHVRSTSTPVTPLNLLAPGEQRVNDSYDNLTLSTKLGVDLNEHVSINYVGRYTTSNLHFTGDDFSVFPSVPAATPSLEAVQQYFSRGEVVNALFGGRLVNTLGLNYSDTNNLNAKPGSDDTYNRGRRLRLDDRAVAALLPGQTLVFGADEQTDSLRQNEPLTNARTRDVGGFVELQSNFADRAFLTSNVRHDDDEQFGGHTTFRVAPAVLVPGINTKLSASYGTGFKRPTLSELFVSFPAFGFFGNPNLLPEQSKGFDAGVEQPVFGDRLRVGATYFNNDILNLIVPNETGTSYANIGRARTWGAETFAALAITEQLKLRADYTYTRAGLELLRRPRHKGSFTMTWRPIEPLLLSATLVTVSDFIDISRDGSIPRLHAPGYSVVNIAANYKIDQHAELFARVDNLFNVQYENPTGFMRPGIGAFGGMRLYN